MNKIKAKIKKATYLTLFIIAVLGKHATAQNTSLFPKGVIGTNKQDYTGTIWLNELIRPDSNFTFAAAQAIYAPGSKLNWHIHPGGQYLLITEGTGYYQERGKPVQVVHKGDIIKCLPGVAHWHGAVPNSNFAYIAISPTTKGSTIWMQPVTEEQYRTLPIPVASDSIAKQAIIKISKQKWQWMADKNIDSLNKLFDDKSMFIHMGGTWGKSQELATIKSGNIWYKKAEVYSVTVNIFGNTAILLNDIDLEAVVGGNTVTNPFMVTEVYIKEDGNWEMASLTFSHLLRAIKMK